MLQKWFRSSLNLFTQRIGIQVIGAFAQLLIIPFLSPSEFGEYLLLVSIGQLLSPLQHFGIQTSITKIISNRLNKPNEVADILAHHGSLIVFVNLIFGALFVTLLLIVNVLVGDDQLGLKTSNLNAAALVFLVSTATASELLIPQMLLALEKVSLSAFLGGGPRNLLFLALSLTMIATEGLNLNTIILIQSVSCLLAVFLCGTAYIHNWRMHHMSAAMNDHVATDPSHLQIEGNDSRSALKLGLSVMGSYSLAQSRNAMEPVLIRLIFGLETTGIVGTARRIANIIILAANAFSSILGPFAVRHRSGEALLKLQRIHGFIALATAALSLFGVVFLITFGSTPLTFVFGVNYGSSYQYLTVILILLMVRCLLGFPLYALLVRGGHHYVLLSYIFDLIASAAVYMVAAYVNNIMFAIVGVGLVQILQYMWLWQKTRLKLRFRTDAFVVISDVHSYFINRMKKFLC